jgi:hypothetical protein
MGDRGDRIAFEARAHWDPRRVMFDDSGLYFGERVGNREIGLDSLHRGSEVSVQYGYCGFDRVPALWVLRDNPECFDRSRHMRLQQRSQVLLPALSGRISALPFLPLCGLARLRGCLEGRSGLWHDFPVFLPAFALVGPCADLRAYLGPGFVATQSCPSVFLP